MNIFLTEEELKEVKPLDPSEDKGLVINPTVGKREEGNSDLVKEIAAIDAMVIGPSAAAIIHGVPQSSVSKYSNGKDIGNNEARARVMGMKYDIEDMAVAKLMTTLDIINPHDFDRPRDKIALVAGLSSLVDKISGKSNENDVKQVHLHLYAPNQKKEQDYEVIDA